MTCWIRGAIRESGSRVGGSEPHGLGAAGFHRVDGEIAPGAGQAGALDGRAADPTNAECGHVVTGATWARCTADPQPVLTPQATKACPVERKVVVDPDQRPSWPPVCRGGAPTASGQTFCPYAWAVATKP